MDSLPVARCASASEIPSSEAAETAVGRVRPPEAATAAAAPGGASHHVAEDESGEEAIPAPAPIAAVATGTAGPGQPRKEDDRANDQRPGNSVGGCVRDGAGEG